MERGTVGTGAERVRGDDVGVSDGSKGVISCLLRVYYHIYNPVESQGREKAGNGLGAADETRLGDVTRRGYHGGIGYESDMIMKCTITDKFGKELETRLDIASKLRI